LLEDISQVIKKLKKPNTTAIGVALPGQIDQSKGVLHYCHHYPEAQQNLPIAKQLSQKFKLPVFIDHDLNCFVLAEAILGRGKKYPIVAGITIGTGFGFGLSIDQEIYHGSQNIIEFGHTIVDKNGPKCSCGGFGHLESYVCGKAMVRLYEKEAGRQKDTRQIVQAAENGQKAARVVLATMSDYLTIGLANIIYSYNPNIIIIGGGLSQVNQLINPARQKTKKLLLYPDQLKTKIVKVKNAYHSNILGAALITKK